MKKKYGIKPILASLLVTASLATPMVVMSEAVLTDIDGEILFEGHAWSTRWWAMS